MGFCLLKNLDEAKRTISILTETADSYGLMIKEKSNIMIYDKRNLSRNNSKHKGGPNIKYLGVKITEKRECFKEYKNGCILKARQFAYITFSTVANACNKIIVGKIFWKYTAIPSSSM